jgi:hypothetical protein
MEIKDLLKKWQPILEAKELPEIKDQYRKECTAILLENQDKCNQRENQVLAESAPANVTANVSKYDPVLIQLIRRMAPNLMAYDVCGVQPMDLPNGIVFAMRAKYGTGATGPLSATEALYNEANTAWSGTGTHGADIIPSGIGGATGALASFGVAAATASLEGAALNKMGVTIEKVTVEAKTRGLSADFSLELAQDMKAVHKQDADTVISDILNTELLSEINREVIRTIYKIAKFGAQSRTANAGGIDLDVDTDGRWSVERFKGLHFYVESEAHQVAKTTRRGKGNIIICSADVATALAMSGQLDYAPALSTDLTVDDTGNTFAGILNKKYKVYVDPYFSSGDATWTDIMVVGYKGSNALDAGLFYCPYQPLVKLNAVDPTNFTPVMGFKTRYGMVANPLNGDGTTLAANSNFYYRRVLISNIL